MNLEELESEIRTAAEDYYSGNPSISDDEFDALLEELRTESPGNALLQTIAYGYDPAKDTSGEKINHKYQVVGSLNKINAETCEKYFSQRPGQYVVTSKIDGGSIVCYYDGLGNFDKAITRGDGFIGIDCTSKLKYLVPKSIPLHNIAIRGEITIAKSMFEKYYPNAANPRNTALGIINKDEPALEEIKRLTFLTYNIYGDGEFIPKNKSSVMQWLTSNGFASAEYSELTISVLDSGFLEGLKGRFNPEFLADGLVITNECNRFVEIAYKFVAETAETTVTKVEWETSRLGSVIPIVYFNPVKLSGAKLAKCSGFNAAWIINNAIGKGSKIIVHRAGEVIPYIKSVLSRSSGYMPTHCPTCWEELEWKGVHLCCQNPSCPKKIQSNLLHWIEKMAPVDSLGENILVPFLNAMGWKNIPEIYLMNLEIPSWENVIHSKFTTQHASKTLFQMYSKLYSDKVDPDKFFAAFGLPAVGETISKKISDEIGIHEYFKDIIFPWGFIEKLSRKTEPAVESLYENYAMMKSVYLQIKNRQGFIEKEASKMKIKVAITGKLSKPRKELIEEFASHGIEVVDSVRKECSYLITDDPFSGSSKNLAAQKLGVNIIAENDFRSKLNI